MSSWMFASTMKHMAKIRIEVEVSEFTRDLLVLMGGNYDMPFAEIAGRILEDAVREKTIYDRKDA